MSEVGGTAPGGLEEGLLGGERRLPACAVCRLRPMMRASNRRLTDVNNCWEPWVLLCERLIFILDPIT